MDRLKLNSTQLKIINYLYSFRFITSSQLQKLLGHKYVRTTNYHLNRLITKDLVGRNHSRKLGYGNLPAVYYLRYGSIPLLKKQTSTHDSALKRIYKERLRSQRFIGYCHFLVEYYLYLKDSTQKKGKELYFYTKTDLLTHHYFVHPLPNAFFSIIYKKGEVNRFFVETINDGSPRFAIRNRISQYSDYFDSGNFEKATGFPLPTLLIICPDIATMIYLTKHLERIYDETSLDRTQVYLSTREEVFTERWRNVEYDNNQDDTETTPE